MLKGKKKRDSIAIFSYTFLFSQKEKGLYRPFSDFPIK
ncbi:hypothetical protein FTV88_2012 [Heliorestis convoluta]|uniref:Uncharacterized protein n=1 Tax=Heliorestis convoluta TaxID=356322 RepID=A0A5Q2N767_9FIRM|nr:hypothetical protein FTV88_2012 [Heliorestis convoluta]